MPHALRQSWLLDRRHVLRGVGVSLATPAILRFRQRTPTGFRRASLEVLPRSAYLLSAESRWDWEHRIVPGEQLRCSITFRKNTPASCSTGANAGGRAAGWNA